MPAARRLTRQAERALLEARLAAGALDRGGRIALARLRLHFDEADGAAALLGEIVPESASEYLLLGAVLLRSRREDRAAAEAFAAAAACAGSAEALAELARAL
ncbi:MAG: hypothetical protein JWN66_1514, partial [Sphingomonas bacterium]|uniref:hypothetical protein n=1 Tax=Sphingomonas bacterium TaxID=1895847 RepID=UPI00261C62E1